LSSHSNERVMKLKISALIFLLFAQTLAYQISLPDIVLCVGDNGHIALEVGNSDNGCVLHPSFNNISQGHHAVTNRQHLDADYCMDIVLDWHLSSAQLKHDSKAQHGIRFSNYIIINPAIHIVKYEQSDTLPNPGVEIARSTILII